MPTDILYTDRYGDAHRISGLKSAIRESAADDPQPEGIVVDQKQDTLYIGFETIGLYKIARTPDLPLIVLVGPEHLLEPVNIFGQSYSMAYNRLSQAGAHYIVDSLADILPVLDTIEAQLATGEKP